MATYFFPGADLFSLTLKMVRCYISVRKKVKNINVGLTKTSVVGQEEKRRLVQLIYSGPASPTHQNITLSVLIFYSPGNIPLRLIRLETLCLPRRGEN